MKKILVTGGTGLVGSHLLYHLVNAGFNPICIKRTNSNIHNVKKIFNYYSENGDELFNQIIWKNCDILDVILLESIIENINYVYHCAALISFNNKLKDEMIETNCTGTSNIIDLAIKHGIQRFCYVSSIATLSANDELPIDENCHWNWENKSGYSISKHLSEMEVWRGFAEGLSGFIVNPSLIIGPGFWNSGVGTIIKKGKLSGPFYAPGSCGVIDVNDLVEIMIFLMNSDIKNERFIINSDHIKYKDLIKIISEEFNTMPPSIKLKSWMVKLFIYIDMVVSKIKGERIEMSLDAVKYTTNTIKLNSSKIDNIIKHKYRNITDSLRYTVQVFKKEN